MKLPISIAEKLLLLQIGDRLPYSSLRHPAVDVMIENGLLIIQTISRNKKQIYLTNKDSLQNFLKNHLGIDNLVNYIEIFQKEELTRAESVEIASNSKLKSIRTFKGFLVNSFNPIAAKINNEQIIINPAEGSFQFIYDFENFILPSDITIVGIENAENFRHFKSGS